MKDTKMQPAKDAVIKELKRAAEHPSNEPVIIGAACLSAVLTRLEVAEKENDKLQAKITEMEKQEPTHWSCNVLQADASWKEEVGREIPPDGYYSIRDIKPLYALPGAQPVPSVPVVTPKMEQAFYEKVEITTVGSIRGLADGIKAAMLAAAPSQEKDNGSI